MTFILGLILGSLPALAAYRYCQRKIRYARAMRHSADLDRRMGGDS